MDTWQEDQIRRMKLGGNAPFRTFMRDYSPSDAGGYSDGMNAHEKYHCWAAVQYKEKMTAELEGKPWSPSLPPSDFASPRIGYDSPGHPSSSQVLRKSRTSARTSTGSSLRQNSASPASFTNSPPPSGRLSDSMSGSFGPESQKAANESYFSSLGSINATRPADLPPSQGGRYQGFGSTPTPPTTSQHHSYGLSSASAPSLSDFQENPAAALSKGWSLLSSVVAGASRTVTESVIQPGLERVRDPSFQESLKGYISEAGKRVGHVGATANQWSKQHTGVDVAESVGGLVDTVKDRVGGRGHEGYGALAISHDGDDWDRYNDGEDDFFNEYANGKSSTSSTMNRSATSVASQNPLVPSKEADDWDDWKDF
ncbi:hypothetical protein EW145_g4666 [Phellinidium pouzarii]|uniref:Arf-GAP domain-containing protein n=1 Tax=Phellinidium pouzarii TaxID=167371 RepID=A0A4S4L2V8_9AGAM|nr:hypothetical protein EW145_g4666 [Phellinidium pouzarii]